MTKINFDNKQTVIYYVNCVNIIASDNLQDKLIYLTSTHIKIFLNFKNDGPLIKNKSQT